nr:MAG TPA: hypothetical protein [Caudoviricetes sp.]
MNERNSFQGKDNKWKLGQWTFSKLIRAEIKFGRMTSLAITENMPR